MYVYASSYLLREQQEDYILHFIVLSNKTCFYHGIQIVNLNILYILWILVLQKGINL